MHPIDPDLAQYKIIYNITHIFSDHQGSYHDGVLYGASRRHWQAIASSDWVISSHGDEVLWVGCLLMEDDVLAPVLFCATLHRCIASSIFRSPITALKSINTVAVLCPLDGVVQFALWSARFERRRLEQVWFALFLEVFAAAKGDFRHKHGHATVGLRFGRRI